MKVISVVLEPIQRVFGSDIPIIVKAKAIDDKGDLVEACGFEVVTKLTGETLGEAFLKAKTAALENLNCIPVDGTALAKLLVVGAVGKKEAELMTKKGADKEYLEKAKSLPVNQQQEKKLNELCDALGITYFDVARLTCVEASCLITALEEAAKVFE